MRALVVDDEAPARRRLVRMLESIEGIDVVGQAEDADSALEAVAQRRTDALFLDVQMSGLSGLALAQRQSSLPPIVFVTAHERYAVDAFAVQAVDYLLKPVRRERLEIAVQRLRALSRPAAVAPQQGSNDRRDGGPGVAALPRVVSVTRGLVRFFDPRDITRFWSSDKYTLFHADGAEQMTEESLVMLEQRLSPLGFLRIHRAELVRTDAVRALRSDTAGSEVVLSDGQVARVSRRALAAIRTALGL
ncbi:MAG TPA: LytTR family DNA-binding domain-containing protein, partial [Polyangiales bacterium]